MYVKHITALTTWLKTIHGYLRLSLTFSKSTQPDPKPDIFPSFSHSFHQIIEEKAQVGQERVTSSGEMLSEEKQSDTTNVFLFN